MKPIGSRTPEEQIAYHLKDGRAPNFTEGQSGRVELAKFLLDKILTRGITSRPITIVELGCGAGDISGPYSGARFIHRNDYRRKHDYSYGMEISTTEKIDTGIHVIGYDITPMAQSECARRWPDMEFRLQDVAEVEPFECDILVMTEFLEHVSNPVKIVKEWMPRAKWAIIGHPLDEPDPPIEPGHIWSYTREDWRRWFEIGGHVYFEEFRFPMAGWDAMILGHSARRPT